MFLFQIRERKLNVLLQHVTFVWISSDSNFTFIIEPGKLPHELISIQSNLRKSNNRNIAKVVFTRTRRSLNTGNTHTLTQKHNYVHKNIYKVRLWRKVTFINWRLCSLSSFNGGIICLRRKYRKEKKSQKWLFHFGRNRLRTQSMTLNFASNI